MLKACMNNYWNCLKHTFSILGVLFVGCLFGLSVFFQISEKAVNTMTTQIQADYQAADLNPKYIKSAVTDRLSKLTYWDIMNVVENGDLTPILEGEIKDSVLQVAGNYKDFADKVAASVEQCAQKIAGAVILLIAAVCIAQIAGFFATEISVRKSLSRTTVLKALLEMLVRLLGYAAACGIIYGLCRLFPDAMQGILCCTPLLLVFFSLVCAWLTARKQGVLFKEAVSFKNYFVLLLADLLMIAISALIIYLLYCAFGTVVSVVIGLESVVILLVALDLSASSCISNLTEAAAVTPAED